MAIGKNKKRVTLTIPDDLWQDICLIADFTGTTKSQVISIITAYISLDDVKQFYKEKNQIKN